MGSFIIFKKKEQSTGMADHFQAITGPLIINSYRKIASVRKLAPTSNTPDQKIIEIYQEVGQAFREASGLRNEQIPVRHLNHIVLNFFQAYETMGDAVFYQHLKQEVDRYIEEGLRPAYQRDLTLF